LRPQLAIGREIGQPVEDLRLLVAALLPSPSEIVIVSATHDVVGHDDITAGLLVQESMSRPVCGPFVVAWLAEEQISPNDMPFLFYSGSHIYGQLPKPGRVGFERWPQLGECEIAAPREMDEGDAIVFHGNTVFARIVPPRSVRGWKIILAPAEVARVLLESAAPPPLDALPRGARSS